MEYILIKHHNLPVYSQKNSIIEALQAHQVIVVESPTGSGKTTQIPIILNEAGYAENGIIGITQPRRIAALGVSRYIAASLGCKVGTYVGYKMRFEDITSAETRLKIMTDGTLLQEMKGGSLLPRYSVLMIDEAHERSLNIDFILGLIKQILPQRPNLKIIISSATLNTEAFSRYFNNAPIVSIKTPVYPVKLHYNPPAIENNEEELIKTIVGIVEKHSGQGDILVFCSGEKMIKDTVNQLLGCSVSNKLQVMPLYGRMGSEEQEKVFEDALPGLVKVVVATNVAETSITIDGITAVVDTGLAKLNFYNPTTWTNTLMETEISRASADQRKGRAGRTQAGDCYRLYSRDNYLKRSEYTREEIFRTDLTEVILRMAEIGIRDFETFPFLKAPSSAAVQGARETLSLLDAIDQDNALTDIGERMARYPLMPRHARMIVEAILRYPDVLKETIIASAFLSTHSPYLLPQGEEMEARNAHHAFRSEYYGDFASYLNLYWSYVDASNRAKFTEQHYLDKKIMDEILAITQQLEEITSSSGIPVSEGGSSADFIKACARGLLPFVCVRDGRFDYRSVGADRIIIHPGSVLFRENPDFIVAGEIVQTSRTFARSVSPIKKAWLSDIHPKLPNMLFNSTSSARHKAKKSSKENSALPKKNTTDQIWIAGKAFPIGRHSGKGNKKRVIFDWKALHEVLLNAHDTAIPDFGSLRGTLIFKKEEILNDLKVNTIIKVARYINPQKNILEHLPGGNYYLHKEKHRQILISTVPHILSITWNKKRTKKKSVGFISLCTDGKGHYWFKSIKSFNRAVAISLESIEDMADFFGKKLHKEEADVLNSAYRLLKACYVDE